MKNSFLTRWGLSLAMLGSAAGPALAGSGYVVPNVPERAQARPFHFPPSSPGTLWVLNRADSGPGSLRAAISNAAPGNTIRFALKLPATIELNSTLEIDKELNILGPSPKLLTVTRSTCSNTPAFSIFHVQNGAVTLAGMSIVNGRASNALPFGDNLGGGIYSEGSLTVSNCVVARNVAPTEGPGYGFGGGIFAYGSLAVIKSTITGNEASWGGGGIATFHSEIVRLEDSTINGNSAGLQSGGVNFQGRTGSFKNCTFSGNTTPADGTASALLHITFENEASDLDVSDCTIARNRGNPVGAVVIAALPGNLGIKTRLIGTLAAENKDRNFFLDGNPVLQSLGHNLDSDGSSGWTDGANGDIVGTEATPVAARLAPLQDNGGPTRTHALMLGSPALDAGSCVDVANATIAADQRGQSRPSGPACDIGAFENQPPRVTCLTLQCLEACAGEVRTLVFDPDGDPLAVVWVVDGTPVQTNLLNGAHPPCPQLVELKAGLPTGDHTIGLRVSDGKAAVAECSSTVKVRDTRPPKIYNLKATPSVLWPANRQMVPVTVTVNAVDACGPVNCKITSVRSSDPTGNEADWEITGDLTLLLRAERAGGHKGRTYTITVRCRDLAGNSSYGTVKVTVPGND